MRASFFFLHIYTLDRECLKCITWHVNLHISPTPMTIGNFYKRGNDKRFYFITPPLSPSLHFPLDQRNMGEYS